MTASSNELLESKTVEFTDSIQKLLNGPFVFSLGSNTNVTLSCRDLSVMKHLQQRADQVILDIVYRVCNLECNIASDDGDDLIYDQKQSLHPSLALIYLLFIQLPDGTENDKCLFHHLSYETKKHMHEIILEHIKQLKEFVHHEMELIQLMLSNQYGIIRMNNYDAHIRDKYLDVIYDTLDTIFGVYKDPNISKSVCRDKPVYMFLLVLKEYSFQDQREYIKTIFLDAHNDGYFIPQQPNDYMDAEDWNNPLFYDNVFDSEEYSDIEYEKPIIAKKIRSFKATQHQVLSILFEHFNRCLTQTSWKDKLIVLKLLNMFDHVYKDWKTYFSIDLLKTVISESLKEDNELVQCELLEFIYQFCNMPYYIKMFVNNIEFPDIIKEVFNHIINQASPYPRLLSSLIKVCEDRRNHNQFASEMLKKLFPTELLWQECIVNLTLKSVQSNHWEVIDSAISFVYTFTYHHIPQFTSLKALSTAIIGLLDRFQNDDNILEHVLEFFDRIIVQLGFKEINQLVQRILFSKQYQPDQIDNFVSVYLIQWIGKSVNNLSIYLPSAMKILLLDQPIDRYFCIDSLVKMYKQPHKTTNQYIQHLITPMIQLHASPTTYTHTTEKAKASKLLSLLFTRTVEYKGIHHQESTLLFQQILDSLAEAIPYDLSRTDPDVLELLRYHLAAATKMVEQIILRRGNITTDQILQIIDLIVQAQHYTISTYLEFRRSWDELPEIDILGYRLDQSKYGINKKRLPSKVELVIDFYDELNIFPLSITMSPTEEISYSEWIDRLMVALEKNTSYSPRDLTKELKQIKEKLIKINK
ncbi:hypothetical protein DFA_05099 [Cavenderia fasciculata]|uniref:Uncharacterized protein n=1 Tax=Cavenderia fasciculata TaxID=261658 RepID=F4PNB6_CACFS|nr:uncharacterized protein DFA_05099 [Cavenderia fasciculata]EGG22969.1 hypothetical protein DFA_05099 [Cavenderia fasciculata]|eukprot:XP_004360820.1 hypothetical protein DFA_05099 [Cavenderia fasciculata]